jgi:hypothetical protein
MGSVWTLRGVGRVVREAEALSTTGLDLNRL